MKHKPYKSIFPYPLGYWNRLNVKGDEITIEERHLFFWWKWKLVGTLNTKTNEVKHF